MAGAGHLRRLAPLLLLSGCAYAEARVRDLGDILRLEGRVGYGLEAHANGGELAHAGLGSAKQWSAGWTYGKAELVEAVQHHAPVSLVRSFLAPEAEHVHALEFEQGVHACFLLFPAGINPGGLEKVPSHFLDVEIGFLAGVAGLEAGVSLGETIDFLLGWATLDFGDDDDPERRAAKSVWRPLDRSRGPSKP